MSRARLKIGARPLRLCAKAHAARFGGGKSRPRSRDDHASFDVRDHGENCRVKFARFVSGIKPLADALQACALVGEFGDDGHDVWDRPPEAIQSPHDQFVALPNAGQGLIQPIAGERHARDAILENRIASGLDQRVILEVGILLMGADADIANPLWRGGRPFRRRLRRSGRRPRRILLLRLQRQAFPWFLGCHRGLSGGVSQTVVFATLFSWHYSLRMVSFGR